MPARFIIADADEAEKMLERMEKWQHRSYIFWLLGIIVGVIDLKPQTVSLLGATFAIEKQEVIQGLLFLGCIGQYLVAWVFFLGLYYVPNPGDLSLNRNAIYMAIGAVAKKRTLKGRRTLIGLDRERIALIKKVARGGIGFKNFLRNFVYFLPLGHILIFKWNTVWRALKALLVS